MKTLFVQHAIFYCWIPNKNGIRPIDKAGFKKSTYFGPLYPYSYVSQATAYALQFRACSPQINKGQ
jgi:hypothetical protein